MDPVDAVDIALVAASRADVPILDRLLQFYEYDYSEHGGIDLDSRGVFPTVDTQSIWQPQDHVFLIRVDGHLAGFAYVTRHESYAGEGEATLLSDILVLRKYRRRGVGARVARTLFDRFPGRWELATTRGNAAAHDFWCRVIGEYTAGAYREIPDGCERWEGPIWLFESHSQGG